MKGTRFRGQIRSESPDTTSPDPGGSPPKTAVTTHSQIRDLILDRTRRYQGLPQPRRRDYNRDRLQAELQTHPKPPAPRGSGGRAHPALKTLPRGGAEAPESRAAAGRRPAIASATLESGGAAPIHSARRPLTTHLLSPMS